MNIHNDKPNDEFAEKLKIEFEKFKGKPIWISSNDTELLKEVIVYKRSAVIKFYFGFETKPGFIHKILLEVILPLNPELKEIIKKVQTGLNSK